ncbi:MAG TPA: hypothetical protein PKC13_18740 [Blastocatellia bacterium]|nr:hypothetical protein [Blastocatellia bacterium]HMY75632.1 hypothetical protein [Blastocatellia bacterium]
MILRQEVISGNIANHSPQGILEKIVPCRDSPKLSLHIFQKP